MIILAACLAINPDANALIAARESVYTVVRVVSSNARAIAACSATSTNEVFSEAAERRSPLSLTIATENLSELVCHAASTKVSVPDKFFRKALALANLRPLLCWGWTFLGKGCTIKKFFV